MEIRASFIEERINATRLIEVGVNFREISNSSMGDWILLHQ